MPEGRSDYAKCVPALSRHTIRNRLVPVAFLAFIVLTAGLAWAAGSRVQSPEQAAARAGEPLASWITAPVERRVLSSTVVLRGDVVPEVSVEVGVPSSVEGVGVVTRLGPGSDESVAEGSTLVVVSGRPVFLLRGSVPAYRTLAPGMSGDDVAQLQAALKRLGYEPDMDGAFGEATKRAVASWYANAGFEPMKSEVSSADVADARRGLDEAEAALADADAALIEASGSGSGLVAAQIAVNNAQRSLDDAKASKSEAVTNAQVAFVNAQAALDRTMADADSTAADRDAARAVLVAAQTGLDAAVRHGNDAVASAQDALFLANVQLDEARVSGEVATAQVAVDAAVVALDGAAGAYLAAVLASGPTVALGEVVFVSSLPARVHSTVTALGPVSAGAASDGAGGGEVAEGSLVDLEAGALVVTTSVRSGDEGLIRVGMPVEMLDEATGVTFDGEVSSIADQTTLDVSGQLGRATMIEPVSPLPDDLTGVNLRVTVTAASSDARVLVVPLAAVSAGADGTTRVSVLPSGAEAPVDVPVKAGLSADGFVSVEPVRGSRLAEGDLVVVGR